MKQTTKEASRGKWDVILAELIGEHAVARKHGPCPICGGKDRYRYDNKRNDSDWFCNFCGVGDGFKLLTDSLGISFAEAAQRVDRIVGNIEEMPFVPSVNLDKRRRDLNRAWKNANTPKEYEQYLVRRGIPVGIIAQVNDVRGHPALDYYRDDGAMVAVPAMVALIRNAKGQPVSIHRTYFGSAGTDKKIMPTLETITGGCIRLGEPDDTLVLAEGIETALAAWALTGYPAWATISAHGLAEFKAIPKHVKKVIICADNDASFTGQAAAFECAKRMKQGLKLETVVTVPQIMGFDMLDVLTELRDGKVRTNGGGLLRWSP